MTPSDDPSDDPAALDSNGNVGGLVSATDGTLTAKYDYNAFGETVLSEGSFAAGNPFRFSTKYEDGETKLVYYGFRYYNPSTGRWLSRDPIEENGGLNLYGMVGNDPVSRIDPLGLFAGFGPTGPINTSGYPTRPYVPGQELLKKGQDFSASAASMIDQVNKQLPGIEGGISPISWTFIWVPYPGGRWSVDASVSGSVVKCRHPDGRMGLMGDVSIEISTTAGLGYGAGGNQGLRKAGGNKLRNNRGRYAKNPEKGRANPEAESALTSGCAPCENTLDGSITIEVGGKAGAVVSVNPYANVSFAFSDPVSFDYGVRAGVSGYVGAELYLKAAANGSGTLIIK